MGRYEDFQSVTRHALRHSCKTLGLPLDASSEAELLAEYGRLAAFPDVAQALSSLGRFTRAILSNGSPAMLEAVLRHSGLSRHFDHVLSVDAVQIYKPHPKVYQFAADQLGTGPGEIGFVSSNFWDISGAASFGFRTFWLNRSRGLADELGQQPQLIVSDLSELVAHLLREDPYQA
jgi:2-haloacid dehalogenase